MAFDDGSRSPDAGPGEPGPEGNAGGGSGPPASPRSLVAPISAAALVVVVLVGVVLLFTGNLGPSSAADTPTTEPSAVLPGGGPAGESATDGSTETSTGETATDNGATGESATDDTATDDTATTPAGPVHRVDGEAQIEVPTTSTPAPDAAGNQITYEKDNLVDGDPATAWRMDGDGRGAVLRFTFDQPVRLSQVGLINGYAKTDPTDGTDRYAQMRRITHVTWTFDDGRTMRQALQDGVRTEQLADVPDLTVRSVTLRIDATARPPRKRGLDYTPISEVYLMGSS
jgi:hypothetical protein